MTCDAFFELISADLDGELDTSRREHLDAHLARCASCTYHYEQARSLRQNLRLHAASELADITPPRPSIQQQLRSMVPAQMLLLVIGATLVALNLGDLFAVGTAELHVARHDAVFGTALGIGMLSVAWRPHRAMGLVPLTSTIALLMVLVGVADLAGNRANMLAEAIHLLELGGLAVLWTLSGGPARLQRRWGSLALSTH